MLRLDSSLDSSSTLFSLAYLVFALGLLTGSSSLRSLGLSADHLTLYLWPTVSEEMNFFEFQTKRSTLHLLLEAALPCGYFLGLMWVHLVSNEWELTSLWSSPSSLLRNKLFILPFLFSISFFIVGLLRAYSWSREEWKNHPYMVTLRNFAHEVPVNDADDEEPEVEEEPWRRMRTAINTEFRSVDKFARRTTPFSMLVVTDRFLVMVGRYPWNLELSKQSDIRLRLIESDHHNLSLEGHLGGVQYLSIQVIDSRLSKSFQFRLSSLDFQNLQDKLGTSIENEGSIHVFKTVSERFVEAFVDAIHHNPRVRSDEEDDSCVGCMEKMANVKLIRRCDNRSPRYGDQRCVNCNCRPMWCVDCMAKWFVSRQDQSRPEIWMASTCPCPSCRSRFCIHDVSIIASNATPGSRTLDG